MRKQQASSPELMAAATGELQPGLVGCCWAVLSRQLPPIPCRTTLDPSAAGPGSSQHCTALTLMLFQLQDWGHLPQGFLCAGSAHIHICAPASPPQAAAPLYSWVSQAQTSNPGGRN